MGEQACSNWTHVDFCTPRLFCFLQLLQCTNGARDYPLNFLCDLHTNLWILPAKFSVRFQDRNKLVKNLLHDSLFDLKSSNILLEIKSYMQPPNTESVLKLSTRIMWRSCAVYVRGMWHSGFTRHRGHWKSPDLQAKSLFCLPVFTQEALERPQEEKMSNILLWSHRNRGIRRNICTTLICQGFYSYHCCYLRCTFTVLWWQGKG